VDSGRRRHPKSHGAKQHLPTGDGFVNPYPQMSAVEARVHLELERRKIPFSWRLFDGLDAPQLSAVLPDYAPEFTLREYRIVIVVSGNFFGTLPGVIDRTALASALLEADHWKLVVLFESDILNEGIDKLLDRELPELAKPTVTGPPRPNPYAKFMLDVMNRRRLVLSSVALARKKFTLKESNAPDRRSESRRKRRRAAGREGGRKRRPRNL
jgi:hypothetical protein